MPRTVLAFTLIIVGLTCCLSALTRRAVSTAGRLDIAALFTGMEFTDEVHWAYVFERDRRLPWFSMGRKGTGAWHIEGR
jgi:hypothetical protein